MGKSLKDAFRQVKPNYQLDRTHKGIFGRAQVRFSKYISDTFIIGGRGAAAVAALPASRCGAKVTVISKESSFVAGATIMAGGGTFAVFKPDDSAETFYYDIMRGEGYLNPLGLYSPPLAA
jgi:ribulose 1,5-bisphosphate synthetase/thiazole synthase